MEATLFSASGAPFLPFKPHRELCPEGESPLRWFYFLVFIASVSLVVEQPVRHLLIIFKIEQRWGYASMQVPEYSALCM